jgi:tape measure domain-containing protein
MADYRGFQGVVAAIERLKETVQSESAANSLISRAIRADLRTQISVVNRLEKLVLGVKQSIKTPSTKVNSFVSKDLGQQIGLQIAKELRAKPVNVKIQESLFGAITRGAKEGLGQGFSYQIVKGFDKAVKRNIGVNFESAGFGAGNVATNPRQAIVDAIKSRKEWQAKNKGLREAFRLSKTENPDIKADKENIFVVGGADQVEGRGGINVKRKLINQLGRDKNIIPVENKESDVSLSDQESAFINSISNTSNRDDFQSLGRSVKLGVTQLNQGLIRGYNNDAVKLASKVIAAKRKNPNAKIKLAGYSDGGRIVDEAIAILENAGINDVTGVGIGTPEIGTSIAKKNYQGFLGEKDLVRKNFPMVLFPNKKAEQERLLNLKNQPNADLSGHDLSEYLNHLTVMKEGFNSIGSQAEGEIKTYLKGITEYFEKVKEQIQSIKSDTNIEPVKAEKIKEAFVKELDQIGKELENGLKEILKVDSSNSLATETEKLISQQKKLKAQGLEVINNKLNQPSNAPSKLSLKDKYTIALDKFIKDAQKTAEAKIKGIIPNYSDLTSNQKQQRAREFSAQLNKDVKKFRDAIINKDRELAKELGEKILKDSQAIKKVYDDLIEVLPENSQDLRSVRGLKGNLTAIQSEVIKGSKGKGRAQIGLTQLIDEANTTGVDVSRGFNQGIEDSLAEIEAAGVDLGETALQGAKDALDIASPSGKFEDVAENSVQGYINGLKAKAGALINNVKNLFSGAVDGARGGSLDSIGEAVGDVDLTISSLINQASESINGFFNSLTEKFPILGEFKDLLIGVGAWFAFNQIVETIVGSLTQLANSSFYAVVQFEGIQRAMTALTGSSQKGGKGLNFVSKEARRLGLDLKTAEENYLGLVGVTRFTPLEGFQTNKLFSTLSKTAAIRGLSNEQQSRMFAAINQAISKRKLSAEEIRGQLGEIPGLAFESTLARSLGVSPSQLNQLMEQGLFAEDVFPKVVAQYAAENNAISGISETTTQSINRLNNAVLTLQRGFAGWVEGSKVLIEVLANIVEFVNKNSAGLVKFLSVATLYAFSEAVIFIGKVLTKSVTAQTLFAQGFLLLKSAIRGLIPELINFLKQFILLTLAIEAFSNVLTILNNGFPELQKDIEKTRNRVESLEAAFNKLAKAGEAANKNLPISDQDVWTDRSLNIFGWNTGLKLEPIRDVLGLKTLGAKEAEDFQIGVSNLVTGIDSNLNKDSQAKQQLARVQEIDKQLNIVRSRRFNIPLGDKDAYNKSLETENKLLEKRDELLKVTAQFQSNLEADRTTVVKYLALLDELAGKQGITRDAEAQIRQSLESRLKDIDQTKSTFEDLTSSLERNINGIQLALRNLNEQAAYFNETLERNATNARVSFVRRATGNNTGSSVIGLGQNELEQQTLEARAVFLGDQLGAIAKLLSDPQFSSVLGELQGQAQGLGLNLENTATIDRLLQEGRSAQETAVLNALKQQLDLKNQLGQTEEQLAQSILTQKNALFDFNRTVTDYFFNLSQQIKEAQIETGRLLEQSKTTDLKTKLQRALVPGSDTFINGLIGQIQGIFDEAASITERLFGQQSSVIQFRGEQHSLNAQLIDFTRNVNGASEAVKQFADALLGRTGQNTSSNQQLTGNALPVPVNAQNPPGARGQLPPPPPLSTTNNLRVSSQRNQTPSNAYQPFFHLLFKGEGNINSANRGRAGDTPGGFRAIFGRNADEMTLGEVLQAQRSGKVFAVGFPQFIPGTLREAATRTKIPLNTPFNRQTQEALAIDLINNKRPNIGRYLRGESNNLTEAAQDAAREWAAIGLTYPEAGRGVNRSRYGGFGGNAASITSQQVQQALQQVRSNLQTPSTTTNNSVSSPDPLVQQATNATNTLINFKGANLDLQNAANRQEIEKFILNLIQTREQIQRQLEDSLRNTNNQVIDATNQLEDIKSQYSPATQTSEFEKEARAMETQFRTFDNQLFEQERSLLENIRGIQQFSTQSQEAIKVLRGTGSPIDAEQANFLESLTPQLQKDLGVYQGYVQQIQAVRKELRDAKVDANNFVVAQAQLRAIQKELDTLGKEVQLSQQNYNFELERSVSLAQSNLQLQKDEIGITQDYADKPQEMARQLAIVREQARLREIDIEYNVKNNQLTRQLQQVNRELANVQKTANLEKQKELEFIQSQLQLEQEILQIKKEYPNLAQQELEIQKAQEAARLREIDINNRINSERINRRSQIRDLDSQIAENEARLTSDPFAANDIREANARENEKLRFDQQVEQFTQQYAGNPELLNQRIGKALTIHQQNLELIDRQYLDLGQTIGSSVVNSVGSFIDALRNGQNAFDAFIDSVLQGLGQIGSNLIVSSIQGLFGFNGGGFAGGFAEGGTVADALRKEGPNGVLAVFTPGEEILSLKTGEAQRYQGLKEIFGNNPLKQINFYKNGGTVEGNLLNNISVPSPRLNIDDRPSNQTVNNSRNSTININVTSPNASSFAKSERQLGRLIREYENR